MRVTLALATIAGLATAAVAFDSRQLVKFPAQDPATFCSKYIKACKAYKPDGPYAYYGSLCEPGDYRGQHNRTEARVVCTFVKLPGTLYTNQVAGSVGATPISQ